MSYQCKDCSSTFTTCNQMIRHTYSPDNRCKEILCSCCGSDFNCSKLLGKHIVKSPFITCNEMIRHTYSSANQCGEIKCSCYGSDFDCPKLLHKHIVTHEYEKKSHVINNPSICGNITFYTCMFCPKQFKSISALNKHIRVHTGSRPFRCYLCGDRFKQK